MDNEPKAEPGARPPVTCVHCGADRNRRTGKPFNEQAIRAHLKACPKRSNLPQETTEHPAAGNDDGSLPQGANKIMGSSRRERHNPASLSPLLGEKAGKAGRKEGREGPAFTLAPEANPGDNDPVDLPLALTRKDASYLVVLLGGALSDFEESVTYMFIRGSTLNATQNNVLFEALRKLKRAEDEFKEREALMKRARMTPEEREAERKAESEERKRRFEEQQAAWNADIERIKQRDAEREANGIPFEQDDESDPNAPRIENDHKLRRKPSALTGLDLGEESAS